jgi:hypothetical protein
MDVDRGRGVRGGCLVETGRPVNVKSTANLHVGAQKTFLALAESRTDVSFRLFINDGSLNDIRSEPFDFLRERAYRVVDENAAENLARSYRKLVEREFDYSLPDEFAREVVVGTIVRVPLHGRRVRGWITALDVEPEADALRDVLGISSSGPPADVVERCAWTAWRYCGPCVHVLRAASPPNNVRSGPQAAPVVSLAVSGRCSEGSVPRAGVRRGTGMNSSWTRWSSAA